MKGLKVGDRVVSDTPLYSKRETRFGGWQRFVVGKAALSAKVCFAVLLLVWEGKG